MVKQLAVNSQSNHKSVQTWCGNTPEDVPCQIVEGFIDKKTLYSPGDISTKFWLCITIAYDLSV